MNCKPNDLAMVVRSNYPAMLGRVIRVTTLLKLNDVPDEQVYAWLYEGDLFTDQGGRIAAAEDCCLRPLRNPDDDAVDEMVQLVGNATARTA
jgi:hypothetical protein